MEEKLFTAGRPFDGGYVLCRGMAGDRYFPPFLVEKVQACLRTFIEWVQAGTHTYLEIQEQLDKMTVAINDLQEEFEENGSEIETAARDSIGESVAYILDWFGIAIDVEDAIRERDW